MLHISSEANSFLESWTYLFSHFWVTQALASVITEICQDPLFVCSDLIQDGFNLNLWSDHAHILSGEKHSLLWHITGLGLHSTLCIYGVWLWRDLLKSWTILWVSKPSIHVVFRKNASPHPLFPTIDALGRFEGWPHLSGCFSDNKFYSMKN